MHIILFLDFNLKKSKILLQIQQKHYKILVYT